MNSSFGEKIKITIFGGSHEPEIGVHIQGLPRFTAFDLKELQEFLDERAPGNSPFTTTRKEPDLVRPERGLRIIDNLAVITEPVVTLTIANTNTRSEDYKNLRDIPRPGHADYTAWIKYGNRLNMAGGGPFSARMTAPLCIAGGIALQLLRKEGVEIGAHLYSVGSIRDAALNPLNPDIPTASDFPTISREAGEKMKEEILSARKDGDSVGGIVEVYAKNCPAGLGGPMYDGVESVLSPIFLGSPQLKESNLARVSPLPECGVPKTTIPSVWRAGRCEPAPTIMVASSEELPPACRLSQGSRSSRRLPSPKRSSR